MHIYLANKFQPTDILLLWGPKQIIFPSGGQNTFFLRRGVLNGHFFCGVSLKICCSWRVHTQVVFFAECGLKEVYFFAGGA